MYLNYITSLRAIAILTIVLHHSIFAFSGWPPCVKHGVEMEPYFHYICPLLRWIGLGVFTFISGYLFNIGITKRPDRSFIDFVKNKTFRLLLPLIFFALLYELFFPAYVGQGYSFPLIEGSPLWYLPMLFIVLMTSFAITKVHGRKKRVLAIICAEIAFYIMRYIGIPFTGDIAIYFPCFVLGEYIDRLQQKQIILPPRIVIVGILIAICYAVVNPSISSALPSKVLTVLSFLIICISAIIIFTFFQKANIKLSPLFHYIGKQSFGIYLIHQFIINTLVTVFFFEGVGWLNVLILFGAVISVSILLTWILKFKPIARYTEYIGI